MQVTKWHSTCIKLAFIQNVYCAKIWKSKVCAYMIVCTCKWGFKLWFECVIGCAWEWRCRCNFICLYVNNLHAIVLVCAVPHVGKSVLTWNQTSMREHLCLCAPMWVKNKWYKKEIAKIKQTKENKTEKKNFKVTLGQIQRQALRSWLHRSLLCLYKKLTWISKHAGAR